MKKIVVLLISAFLSMQPTFLYASTLDATGVEPASDAGVNISNAGKGCKRKTL